ELHEQKRKFTLAPNRSPPFYQGLHSRVVLHSLAKIGLALVPNCAAYRKRHKRMDHAVVKPRTDTVAVERMGRSIRGIGDFLAGGFSLVSDFDPCAILRKA